MDVAQAFINVEKLRKDQELGFQGESELSFAGEQGNTEKAEVGLETVNQWLYPKRGFLLIGSIEYGESKRQKDEYNGAVHFRYKQRALSFAEDEYFIQEQFNEFKSLSRRELAGLGLRWLLIEEDSTELFAGTGAFFEVEKYDHADDTELVRGNFYLALAQSLGENSSLSFVTYFQPATSDAEDYRIQNTTNLKVKMSEAIGVFLKGSYSYDNQPIPGVEKRDFKFKSGFSASY